MQPSTKKIFNISGNIAFCIYKKENVELWREGYPSRFLADADGRNWNTIDPKNSYETFLISE